MTSVEWIVLGVALCILSAAALVAVFILTRNR